MIRYKDPKQMTIEEFDWPFISEMDKNNRWVKLSETIPWNELAEGYYQSLSESRGRPGLDARLVIGAVIIKHKLCLSDRETVAQIQENPYLQYFVGLPGFQMKEPFAPSLFVEIRKRMGEAVFDVFQDAIIHAVDKAKAGRQSQRSSVKQTKKPDDSEPPASSSGEPPSSSEIGTPGTEATSHQGKLLLDATVCPQAIRYPTDLNLLNEAREFSEQIIDILYASQKQQGKKPRTYRIKARKDYLKIAKQKRASAKGRRRGIKQQLQYLRRNLKHIEKLLCFFEEGTPLPLPRWLLYRYWVIQHLYDQQRHMYDNKVNRCDERIVSISQPYVRPMVRGKLDKPVEFGAKLSVSLNSDQIAVVDELRWNAFHEGQDLPQQVEDYKARHGYYPEVVLADTIYGSRANRQYLKSKDIRFAGKPLGRPKKVTTENQQAIKQEKAKQREEYRQRIPIEGKFGQGKNGYRLNYIRAKRADTSYAWINSIFLVMNLMVLLRIFFALQKGHISRALAALIKKINEITTHLGNIKVAPMIFNA